MPLSSARLCSVAALLVACDQLPTEEVQAARQALQGTTTCPLGTACAVTLPFPNQFVADVKGSVDVPVVANGRLTIADGVQLEGASGQLSNVANVAPTATSSTEVGARARLGSLWTNGNVTLRSYAYLGGTLWTRGSVEKQDGVTIVGGPNVPTSGISTTQWTVTFPTTSGPNMDLQPDTQTSIAPGAYKDISVKSRATLTLTTGTYYFDSLTLEPQATLKLDNSGGTVVINIRGNLIHRGTISFTGASSDVLIASFGSNDIPIEAEFNGTLVAPYAKIVVGTANGATHDGLFFGKNVEVQAGARVRYKPTSGTGPAIDAITPSVTGDPSTTAPPPPNTDGLGFKSYQDKWGEYIQSLIDQKYTGPVIEIPTHPDALGKQDPADPTTSLPPTTTVTTSPLPATYYSGSIDDAKAEAQASIAQATAVTQERLPEIDQTTPPPPAPVDPEPSTWAKGFCPLEKEDGTTPAASEERISEGFDLGNQPNRSKTFDAYWYANGEFRAGLDSLYKVYARAAFKTGVGVSVNLTDHIDSAKVFDVLALSAEAAAGSLANDGRLFSLPYLNATVKVFGSDAISYRLPKTISTQNEDCRNTLNECQKKGGIYDQCCGTWYGNNKVVDTSKCLHDDFCDGPVKNCKATQDNGAGCLEGWSLLFQPWKVDLWHESIDFLNPPISVTYGAFTLSLNGGTELSIPSYLGVDETGPDVTIAPFGRVFVKAEVAVGAIIYLGVEGQIDVIRVDVPFKGSLKWHFNRSPEVCAAELQSNSSVQMKWSTLNGNIYVTFYVRITNPFTGKYVYIEIARQKVFGWDGFSIESDPWILAEATNPILKLDPSECVLGGESCATDTTSLFSVGDLLSTGQSYKQVPAPYGQKNCEGQAVGEITDASLGTLPGLLVKSTWDGGQTTVPCDQRHSQFTIWVQRDEGKMDPSALPSPYYNWEFWDQVNVGGVPSGSGCLATVSGRYRELPTSIAHTVGAAPYSYVKLDRQAAINRVTKVKVVSHATSNCEELPLENLVLPVYNAP